MASKGKNKKSKNIIDSFKYAIEGLIYGITKVRNMRIHILFTILVVFGGLFFKITRYEYLICLVFIALVISLELMNTAIEDVVDLASPEVHPLAKKAKDVAAASVLVSSAISFIVGIAIFMPRILNMFHIGG